MNKRGFIWIFFKKEVLGFSIGLIAGIVITYLIASGVIPLALPICS